MGGALLITGFISQAVVPRVHGVFDRFGLVTPMRVQLTASPWWVAACVAVAILDIGGARAMGPRRSAYVLVSVTLLLLGAAAFTFWSALALSCGPVGEFVCCMQAIR